MTRTEPGASRLARRLAGAGYEVLNAPVLGIEDTAADVPPGCFDFVLFVSAHAVERAFAHGWGDRPPARWTAGIGAATEDALRERGIEPRPSGLRDAAAVTTALAEPPSRMLLVKGEGGRDVVQNWARSHGRSVSEWDVYRRIPATPKLDGIRIDAIVAASGDGLRGIARLWFAGRRERSVPLLVPSARVARLAAGLGFDRLVVTDGAGDDAVAAALAELRETGVG